MTTPAFNFTFGDMPLGLVNVTHLEKDGRMSMLFPTSRQADRFAQFMQRNSDAQVRQYGQRLIIEPKG